jgi:hypothetical protein
LAELNKTFEYDSKLSPKSSFENNRPLVKTMMEKKALSKTTDITPFMTLGKKR